MKFEMWKEISSGTLGLFIGFIIVLKVGAQAAPPLGKTISVLQSHRFELIDKSGILCASLGCDVEKNIAFTLYEKSGKTRVRLVASDPHEETGKLQEAATSLALWDHKGNMEMHLQTSDSGVGELSFGYEQGGGIDHINSFRYAAIKASSVSPGANLSLSSRGDVGFLRIPGKGEASLLLVSKTNYFIWNASDSADKLK